MIRMRKDNLLNKRLTVNFFGEVDLNRKHYFKSLTSNKLIKALKVLTRIAMKTRKM